MWIHYKPSLFQHIGTHSSLKGKVSAATLTRYIPIIHPSYFFYNPIIHCLSYFSGSKAEGSSIWSRSALCSSQEPPSNHRYISKKHKHCKVVTKIIIINPLSESPIKHYKHYSITRAYQGETFFWGLVPQVKNFSFKENTP